MVRELGNDNCDSVKWKAGLFIYKGQKGVGEVHVRTGMRERLGEGLAPCNKLLPVFMLLCPLCM